MTIAYLNRQEYQISDPFVLDDLRQMENARRYNAWLAALIQPYLGRQVLEIGPGIGNISRLVIEQVNLLVGMEPNPHCTAVLAETLGQHKNFHLLPMRVEDSSLEQLRAYRFDTILCMNVLEHIKEDGATLAMFGQVLEPGGRVVVLVPAFPQAYGPFDASVGHFRRYTKASLRASFAQSGLVIERMFYTNMLGLLGWIVNARILKIARQSDTQIKIFDTLVPLLSRIERGLPHPFGMSLVASARKVQP